jgi:hypothetical protein
MSFSRSQRGPRITTEGLVLYLDAANPTSYPGSGTDWFDLTLNSDTGTLINGPTFGSNYGGIISFDGIDDYVITTNPSNLSSTSQFTLSIWTNGTGYIFGSSVLDSTISNDSGVSLNLMGSGGEVYISDGISGLFNNLYVGFSSGVISNFYNFTITYDGSNDANGINCYVNGELASITINANNPLTDPFTYNIPWVIGAILQDIPPLTPVAPSTGDVSISQVYNRVLSGNEILQNFNNLKSRFNLF